MIKKIQNKKIAPFLVCLFFLIYFVIGIFLFRDYGISTDEPFERTTMYININYITTLLGREPMDVDELATYEDKYYGMVMQMPTIIFEAGDKGMSYIYTGRHLYTFIVCFIGYLAFFDLCRRIFHSKALGILGTVMIAFYPRFFAEQFYNIKDMVFVAVFMVTMWVTERLITSKFSWQWVILFTIASAVASNARIFGFITMALVIGYIWIVCMLEKIYGNDFYHMTWKRALLLSIGMLAMYLVLWVVLLPGAWESPIQSLVEMFTDYSDYDWNGDIVFGGSVISKEQLSWYYLPVWLLISVPVWYMICFCISGCIGIKDVIEKVKEKKNLLLYLFFEQRFLIWSIMLFVLPLFAIIVLKATIYSGWRHCYFILPPLVLAILYGVNSVAKRGKQWQKAVLGAVIIIGIASQLKWMVVNHPHEMVYFNEIGRKYAAGFDRDYWYLAEKQALEYIALNDESDNITVNSSGTLFSLYMLDEDLRNRIERAEEPTYYIETYRGKVGNEVEMAGYEEIYSIVVDDFRVATVLKKVL